MWRTPEDATWNKNQQTTKLLQPETSHKRETHPQAAPAAPAAAQHRLLMEISCPLSQCQILSTNCGQVDIDGQLMYVGMEIKL